MTSEPAPKMIPIACDMTDAPDTASERVAEYRRLFAQALTGRERTDGGCRLRFRADAGVEAWVRDLAAREKACCPFFDFSVSANGGEVWWDAGVVPNVVDDQMARTILDEFYQAPDTVADGVAGMVGRLDERGLAITTSASGTVTQVHRANADG